MRYEQIEIIINTLKYLHTINILREVDKRLYKCYLLSVFLLL